MPPEDHEEGEGRATIRKVFTPGQAHLGLPEGTSGVLVDKTLARSIRQPAFFQG